MNDAPNTLHAGIYAAARLLMRGARSVFLADRTAETRSVYRTRPSLLGFRTTERKEPTWLAMLLMMVTVALFAVALALFVVGLVVHAVESPLRAGLTSRGHRGAHRAPAIGAPGRSGN